MAYSALLSCRRWSFLCHYARLLGHSTITNKSKMRSDIQFEDTSSNLYNGSSQRNPLPLLSLCHSHAARSTQSVSCLERDQAQKCVAFLAPACLVTDIVSSKTMKYSCVTFVAELMAEWALRLSITPQAQLRTLRNLILRISMMQTHASVTPNP
jgi:hypothetical protein